MADSFINVTGGFLKAFSTACASERKNGGLCRPFVREGVLYATDSIRAYRLIPAKRDESMGNFWIDSAAVKAANTRHHVYIFEDEVQIERLRVPTIPETNSDNTPRLESVFRDFGNEADLGPRDIPGQIVDPRFLKDLGAVYASITGARPRIWNQGALMCASAETELGRLDAILMGCAK